MIRLLPLLLLACSVTTEHCPPLDVDLGSRHNVERSCPVEEFDPTGRERCSLEAIREYDNCTAALQYFCTGYTEVSFRYADADGALRAYEGQRAIESGCRISWERKERT